MKRLALALLLIPSLAIGAGWDETVTSPQPDDTIMINDVSQPEGSKTQYSSLKTLPVPDLVTTQLNTKVGLSGDETVNGIKNFTSSPILPEPTTDSQAATKFYVDNNAGSGGGGVWGTITGTLSAQNDLWTALLGKVNTTGSESIDGQKTFLLSPIVPTPTTGTQAANKDYVDGLPAAAIVWGAITGTLANQSDLQLALNDKAPVLNADQNYVSNAELTVLQNTSGVNTGDQDLSGFVETTGNETIAGVKTFSSSPIVPTPTTGTQASNKAYADTKAPALGADDNYVTDAEKTIIGNTSGVNTGDQDLSGKVSTTGNETIQGIKTFNSSPVVPTPTTDFQAATKAYVDSSPALDNSRFGTLAIVSDHTVTDQEIKDNTIISNYGAAGTVLATLPDVAYSWKATLTTEADQILALCPPPGQSIRLDGVALDADTCVESEAVNGRMASLLHTRNPAGSMYYNLVSALGDWTAQETGPISLDTGHALGDMVACYILEETDETGLGTSILDLTTNNYDLTLTETSAQGYTREPGGGVYFDQTGEGVAQGFATPITADGFTIVTVMKTPSVGGTTLRAVNLAGSTFSVDMAGVGTTSSTTYITQQTVNDGEWWTNDGTTELGLDSVHAIAGVFTDGSDRELYLNGASESTDTTVSAIQYARLDSICIGAMCDSTPTYTTGTVYAGYIFDRILSPAEAASITADPYQMINNYSGPQ